MAERLRTLLPFVRAAHLYPAALVVQLQSHASDVMGYRRARLVLANTPTAERAMASAGFSAACVPPPIEVPAEPPVRRPHDGLRVAFCSHPLNAPRKGLRYLLDALALTSARPMELTLIGGQGDEFRPAIEAAGRAGVTVRSLGRLPREDYLEHLARHSDVLAFPSLYEEWGYALFEALSRGVPAIAFDLYPFFDIVDEDTGRLVGARDPRALAAALDDAAAGNLPAPERVMESTRRRFGAESVVRRLVGLYEQTAATA